MQNIQSKIYNILRWSEKYTKTDMVYLAKGGFWVTFGQIISFIATFLLAIAFANLFPKELYGTYKYILSIVGILTITTLKGMDTALNQAVARQYEGTFLFALKTKIKWGSFGALLSLLIAIFYYTKGNITLSVSFLIVAVFIPFVDSFSLYHNFLQGKKLYGQSVIYATITQIIITILLVMTVMITNNLFIIIFVYFFSWTVFRYLFFKKTIRKFPPNESIDQETISYGKHSSVINITATLIGALDSILVFHYLGAVALATYSFALAPVAQFRGLFDRLPTLAIPKLANRNINDIDILLKKRSFLLLIIGVIFSVIYIIIAPFMFKMLFPKYLDSVLFSQVFSISIALALAQSIMVSATSAKLTSTPKKFLYLWNIPGIILTISILILIKPFGIMGVIASRLLSLVSGIIINIIVWGKIKSLDSQNIQKN